MYAFEIIYSTAHTNTHTHFIDANYAHEMQMLFEKLIKSRSNTIPTLFAHHIYTILNTRHKVLFVKREH